MAKQVFRGLGQSISARRPFNQPNAAQLLYAASTVYIRCFVTRPPLEMATGSMIVGTVFVGVLVLISGDDIRSIEPTLPSLGTILYLGPFSTGCANLIYFHLVPRLGATRMSQVDFAVPVGGALLGYLSLGEAMTGPRLVAPLIIIGLGCLGTRSGRRSGLQNA
ncbi:DMT family transporter [Roseobacter weihaiensis]|uniref:DMT family transporter n=1 Tax=Roseobacter weihaiensis TaxID=2763262 RepID=UPI001D0AB98D|nr:DMT family transporter [Roseobacter sp. H9]